MIAMAACSTVISGVSASGRALRTAGRAGGSSSNAAGSSSMGLLGEVVESIKIDHTIQHKFTIGISDRWERHLHKHMGSILDLSLYYAESFRFIAVGIGSFFFLWGVSKVVEAGNRSGDDDSKKSSSKTKKSSSGKRDSDNATVVTQSSRTTTGRSRRSSRRTTTDAARSTSPTPPPTTIAFESIAETAEEDSTNR